MSIRRFYRLCPKDSHTCTKDVCLGGLLSAETCGLHSPPSEPTGQGQCPHCGNRGEVHRVTCPNHSDFTSAPYPYGDMA